MGSVARTRPSLHRHCGRVRRGPSSRGTDRSVHIQSPAGRNRGRGCAGTASARAPPGILPQETFIFFAKWPRCTERQLTRQGWPHIIISWDDIEGEPYSVGLLVELGAFLETVHCGGATFFRDLLFLILEATDDLLLCRLFHLD